MIRYRTRDLTRLLPGTARTMRRMEKITGRTDDMIILRGVNLFPTQIEELILRTPALTPHFQCVLSRPGRLDEMTVRVERRPDASADDGEAAADQLRALVKNTIGVSVAVRRRSSPTRSSGRWARCAASSTSARRVAEPRGQSRAGRAIGTVRAVEQRFGRHRDPGHAAPRGFVGDRAGLLAVERFAALQAQLHTQQPATHEGAGAPGPSAERGRGGVVRRRARQIADHRAQPPERQGDRTDDAHLSDVRDVAGVRARAARAGPGRPR